ncbi:MAG TPA: helix-turn-helix domain-containing protein [Candidatus Acidoferrales bacterium]|jgi:AraC-like DNA-binding protein|nr:helix-turn-helix domain-containing protein [Candidatus Acidoferrales bacterium]
MEFRTQTPGPPLSDFIEMLWYGAGAAGPHSRERLLPDGSMELVINLSEDEVRVYDRLDHRKFEKLRGAAIVGPHSEFFVIDTAEQRNVMGVHFKPGGAFPFLPLPADELHGLHISLEDVWGRWAGELRERLLEATALADRFRILEAALLARIWRPLVRHRAVAFALGQFHGGPKTRTIGDVTDQTGLSSRRFIEVFRQQVGLTPKLFCRVRRFQEVVQRVAASGHIDWTDVALSCGYFDQAHFIHDFRAFSGISPTMYAGLRTGHTNHVPIFE